jgi:YggT family protein
MLLIMFRILLTWVQGIHGGRAVEILHRITDPYLAWFRRFTFLRIGNFDFSIVVAIIVLSVLASITARLAAAAVVTFGLVLAIIIARVASAVSFFLVLFLVLAVVRLIGIAANANTAGRFWITLDHLLEPVLHAVMRRLARGRVMNYRTALLLFSALIVVILVVGGFLVDALVSLAGRIPF